MDDMISRAKALHAITSYNGVVDKSVAKRLLIQLPSEQSERKPGKWEIYVISALDGEGCRCSECGFEGASYWDFCPGCGARMENTDNN